MPSAPKRGIREDAGAGRHAAEIRNNSAHFTVALAEANHFLEDRLECAKCGDDDPPMLLKERGLLVSCRGRTLRLGPLVVLQVEQDWLGLLGRLNTARGAV